MLGETSRRQATGSLDSWTDLLSNPAAFFGNGTTLQREAVMTEARTLTAPTAENYLSRIWQMRFLLVSLVRLDLATRYRHSFLGIGWSLIRPVAMSVVFCGIFCRLMNLQVREYAPFVMTGMCIWQFLTEACMLGCSSFMQGAAYIKQRPLPLVLFPLRTVLGCAIHGGISLVLALAVSVACNGWVDPFALIALLPTLVLVFFIALFMATLFGIIHVHFPDTRHLLEISFQIIFYLTPIMYYPAFLIQRNTRAIWLVEFNPFSHVLEIVRQPIWKGEIASLTSYAWSLGWCMIAGAIAVWCLKKMERTLVFWV